MAILPEEIRNYLVSMTLDCRSAAYFKVTRTGEVIDWGGNLNQYDISGVESGVSVWDYLFFVDSFFPLEDDPEQLSCVKFQGDVNANVHLFTEDNVGWVLLLDASYDEEWRSRLQQKGNEFNLLRQKYTKLIRGLLQSPTLERLAPHSPGIQGDTTEVVSPLTQAQHQQNTLLLIKVCELSQPGPPRSPHATLTLLNAYLSIIAQIVGEEGGLIHHVFGETAVALFGLLPACQSPAQQATDAARRMIARFQNFEHGGTSFRSAGLNVGVAITTDVMTSGLVQGHSGHRSLNALGNNVQQTLKLNEWIRPGVILVDNNTFDCLGMEQEQFDPSLLIATHDPLAGQQLYAQDLCHAAVYS